ncbi:cupin domain-containing protein [Segnochrobactrum spirostomi]|uniref:Cupin domain-containing protein n=1 Tax=Segnochrobactrum spirostomi TaxID=2608987 RepID=A0A6A7Y7A7_9HYPH|nr:cupin domain-containing protein [Segnochrobactrum spirostomi]MQT15184.1 cupin domain-containing protein [Segnochrobactrum spirostomi]
MEEISRRSLLAAAAAGGVVTAATAARAASYGNPDTPAQGAPAIAGNPSSGTIPGPQNPALASQFPGAVNPPATDVGNLPLFWASFNNAPRRVENGGWAREVTQADFPISTTIAGVDMRLTRGGIREMHWHQSAEWGFVTAGAVRITTIDITGRANVEDVETGGIWYFPAGLPHSLQGVGEDGAQFILCFDDGTASEYSTLLLTEWMAHTPPEVLALNFGVPADTFKTIPLTDLYIFQGKMPGPLAADQAAAAGKAGRMTEPSSFAFSSQPVVRKTAGGEVRIADSRNFKISKTIAAALVTVHPGGLREMHWHPNADEWQYYVAGKGEMTVFTTGPNAVTQNFNPGDIGYVQKSLGHYIRNVGDTDLVFLEVFRAPEFQDVSLSDWLTHTPPAMVAQHLNVDAATIARFPNNKPEIMPE